MRITSTSYAVEYYLPEAGSTGALAFIDAVEVCLRLIGEHPATGSSRYAHELDLPGLCFRTVEKEEIDGS